MIKKMIKEYKKFKNKVFINQNKKVKKCRKFMK